MNILMKAATGREVSTEPSDYRPFTYDIVYAQHQLLGLLDYSESDKDRAYTTIVTGRLSRHTYLESGGWLHDNLIVDRVLANSELTAEHLVAIGSVPPITTFYNAAPDAFFQPFAQKPPVPRKALIVTNHHDPDLLDAVRILRRRMKVTHIGRSGGKIDLTTPDSIAGTDVVISIGKTVQYALASRTPVFVYDHFGGPGYLDKARIDSALRSMFTGRCCRRKLSGHEIAAEILSDYGRGVTFARESSPDFLNRFRLPRYLDLLREPPLIDNAEKRRRLNASAFIMQERILAEHIRRDYQYIETARKYAPTMRGRYIRRAQIYAKFSSRFRLHLSSLTSRALPLLFRDRSRDNHR